jgi:hypothetical protein
MRLLSVSCFVTALVAASGAFAQNAPQSAAPAQAPTAPAAQSQPGRSTSATEHSKSAMQPRHRRLGPTSGNQVQAPSPDTSASARSKPDTAAQSATETRPDAKYPHPSGQDSQPDNSSHKTKLAAAGSRKDKESGQDQTPDASRSKQAAQLGKRKSYTGNTGSKANFGTACSTARPTVDGGVDCGTSGNSATEGKIVTKPH